MKKIIPVVITAIFLVSCKTSEFIPQAVNTINSVALGDLNLERKDYEVLNTLTAEASITYVENYTGDRIVIKETGDEFTLAWVKDRKTGWSCRVQGVPKFGYLSNDYYGMHRALDGPHPEDVVRQLAIYRIISMGQQQGADGFVEPTVSTNVMPAGNRSAVLKTIVTAKIVKLKVDK